MRRRRPVRRRSPRRRSPRRPCRLRRPALPRRPLPPCRERPSPPRRPRRRRPRASRPSAGARELVAPQPPQVLIDRIEIVTPPASPPAADPLASLAPRRVGAVTPRRRRLMAGVTAIQGVDDTLKKLAPTPWRACRRSPTSPSGRSTATPTTCGSTGSSTGSAPNPAYRNMEPPQTGWRTARGRPPLALQLSVPADRVSRDDDERAATRSSSRTSRSPP